MSYFSEALDAHMSHSQLTNLALANLSGITDPEISRWRRGERQPTDKALAKLLPILSPEVALHLCICWLRDETPEDMRPKIVIQPSQWESAVDLSREDWQQALDYFVKGCEHNALLRQTLVGLHRLLIQGATAAAGTGDMGKHLKKAAEVFVAANPPVEDPPSGFAPQDQGTGRGLQRTKRNPSRPSNIPTEMH